MDSMSPLFWFIEEIHLQLFTIPYGRCGHYMKCNCQAYKVFHGFGQAKFDNGGPILGSNQLSLL